VFKVEETIMHWSGNKLLPLQYHYLARYDMMSTNSDDISIVNTPTIALKIIEDVSSSDE